MEVNDNKKKATTSNKKRASAKKQAEYVRFMFLTIIVGVLICLIVFFAVFISINKKSTPNQSTDNTNETLPTVENTEAPAQIEVQETELIAVIMSIVNDEDKVRLYDFEKDKDLSLIKDSGAEMKDQYGDPLVLAEFKAGDIVQVVYDKNTMKYSSLRISAKAWTQKSVTGLKLKPESSAITLGAKTYRYTSRLTSTYNDEHFDILELDPVDVVTLKGYNDVVWSIEVEKSHGYVNITGRSKIKNGTIEIDTNIYKEFSEEGSIKVKEGSHKLVVKGSNIEPYTKNFTVANGETVEINLSSVPIKTGVVIINANVKDYTLYVNDEIHMTDEPLVLEYGQYDIKITKEDYLDFNTKIVVDSDTFNLNVSMQEVEKVKMGELKVSTIDAMGQSIDNAEVYIDNVKVGISPVTIKLEYGEHTVTVTKEGYIGMSIPVTIEETSESKGAKSVSITLKPSNEPTTIPQATTEPTTIPATQSTTQSSTIEGGEVDINPIY